MTTWRILAGDLFDRLGEVPSESVDACVTDPPYGIGFMGREWDTFKPEAGQARIVPNRAIDSDNPNLRGRTRGPASSPSAVEYDYSVKGLREFQAWTERWATEVRRVLKPGAYIVVCGAPRSHHRMMCGLEDAGFVVRDCFAWLFGSGFPKNHDLGDGKGTALKPAHEPIALAWKPFKGTIEKCHATHGTAALNIDACRLEPGAGDGRENEPSAERRYTNEGGTNFSMKPGPRGGSSLGRWPANVILDDAAAALVDAQTGELVSGANPTRRGSDKFRDTYGEFKGQTECQPARGLDVGGASRFYYCAKPSRAERDASGVRNIHPTVKPVELMTWLVRLVSPEGGLVLDPFTGSGTTGMACIEERRHILGCEREPAYVEIARRRIGSVAPMFSTEIAS